MARLSRRARPSALMYQLSYVHSPRPGWIRVQAGAECLGALTFSVTSFHGRGFFPGGVTLDDPITQMAAVEAVLGLLIEISFIATFTQRFFGAK
jgi:hypothetical protein